MPVARWERAQCPKGPRDRELAIVPIRSIQHSQAAVVRHVAVIKLLLMSNEGDGGLKLLLFGQEGGRARGAKAAAVGRVGRRVGRPGRHSHHDEGPAREHWAPRARPRRVGLARIRQLLPEKEC